MRKIVILVVLVGLAVFILRGKNEKAREQRLSVSDGVQENIPQQKDVLPATSPSSLPVTELVVTTPTPADQEVPDALPQPSPDPFALRNFDLPKPKSLSDLLNHLTPYKLGLLPRLGNVDGSLTKTVRGYYRSDGNLLKLVFDRYSDSKGGHPSVVSVQEKSGGALKMWSEPDGQLKVFNYNDDPYSTVVFLRGGQVIYLKSIASFNYGSEEGLRAMTGWMWTSYKPNSRCYPVALVSMEFKGSLRPGADQNGAEFPVAQLLNPLFGKCP